MSRRVLCFDIEADDLLVPATKVHCVCAEDIDSGERFAWGPDELDEAWGTLASAHRLVGHNAVMYDAPVLDRLVRRGRPMGNLAPIIDTLLISRLLFPDRFTHPAGGNALGDWGGFLNCPKLKPPADWTEFTEEMLEYCEGDVALGVRIYKYLLPRAKKFVQAVRLEHSVAKIITRQILNGFTLDIPNVHALRTVVTTKKAELLTQLQAAFPSKWETMKTPAYWEFIDGRQFPTKKAAKEAGLTGKQCAMLTAGPMRTVEHPFNPGSSDQIAERFKEKYGWNPPLPTKPKKGATAPPTKPSTDDKVLKGLAGKFPEAKLLLEYRLVSKRESQSQEWLDALRPNGRVHGHVTTNGCVTGRMSHSEPNMGAIPKVKNPFGKECRSCWKPRLGWKQVGADASSLEARMLANRMWRWDQGAYAKIVLGADLHTENAKILGIHREDAKTWFYAFCYGAGDEKLGTIAGERGSVQAKRRRGAELRARFMRGLPALGALVTDIKRQVAQRKYLIGLDGRPLPVRSEHSALNTQLQSDGAVTCKQWLVIQDAKFQSLGFVPGEHYEFLANVHDEVQIECQDAIAQTVGNVAVAAIFEAGQALGVKVPLAGEFKIGNNWAECH